MMMTTAPTSQTMLFMMCSFSCPAGRQVVYGNVTA